ncbi:acyl-CoA dehydrogenase family protein [Paractinoplanes ferrugineus]|uniref:Acyl-CoA dehydrogenase n=1 Tax=Paractinoplanes ferrugineus TaxID=113564 RepID=A0A919MB65_9ACTN|nr:acyl-CoA dehydrogenase [Actinoplanes ferrugineus]GIE13336.1 acyl-CoA dehydrogenase [Actinoplanes ferrugineus]
MNVDIDPVQQRLGQVVSARLSTAGLDEAVLRAPDAVPRGPADRNWTALRDIDAPTFDAPLEAGGVELGLSASTLIAERLGRAGVASPYLAVALAIDAAAAGEAEMLASLVAGNIAVAAAGFESVTFESAPSAAVADRLGWYVEGSLPVEPSAADAVLLPVWLDGRDDLGLILLGYDTLKWTALPAAPGGTGTAKLSGALCEPSALLCRLAPETGCAEGPLGRARVRQAAYLVGLAHGALAATVEHAERRRQFDRPLRDFSSVRFRLGQAHAEIEAARLLTARAAWLADSGRPFAVASTEVLALAAEVARDTGRLAMQVGGARSLTALLPLHRFYLRIRLEVTRFGRPDQLWTTAGRRRMTDEET